MGKQNSDIARSLRAFFCRKALPGHVYFNCREKLAIKAWTDYQKLNIYDWQTE